MERKGELLFVGENVGGDVFSPPVCSGVCDGDVFSPPPVCSSVRRLRSEGNSEVL